MKLLRANIWWNAIVPQVLGWCYFFLLVFFTCNGSINAELYLKNFSLFFVSLVCTAMFGYLLNDWCDVDTDKISDKVNLLTKYNTIQKAAISFLPLIIGVIAWFSISKTSMANFFFTLQILSLFLYSVPPFRFKNRGVLGIVADAFYGHINPVLITLFVFPFYEGEAIKYFSEELLFFILLFALSLKGIRNILLHQIEDRKKDKRANIQTYVVKYGGLYTVHLLNKLLPLEIFFTGLLALTISFFVPPFFLSFFFFFVVN
jgi:4-hydroxybenzoate polyprenyltransferase